MAIGGNALTVGSKIRRLLILIAVAIASRAVTFGNPILYTDEEFYFTAGRALTNGALPFVDIWDRKPVGLFLIYALPASLPWPLGIWIYQAMALACAAATAWLIAAIADSAGWKRGGTLAGIAYLLWIVFAGGQGGQSPVFYNLLMALAAWLIVVRQGPGRHERGAAAMLLVGLALQIKYSVVFEGIFFGLWLMHDEWRLTRRSSAVILWGGLFAGVALTPTALAAAFYAGVGEWPAFLYANFHSILARNADPAAEQAGNLVKAALILAPLVAMAVTSRAAAIGGSARLRIFLATWFAVALLAFAILPPWTFHYTLPVVLPGAILAAGFLCRQDQRKAAVGVLVAAAIAGQASLAVNSARRGTPAQFSALAKAVGSGPGCLYVYSSSSMLYPATGRCAVSRYVFPSHLTRFREAGAIGVDQAAELRRIFAAAPSTVVMGPPYEGERPDIRAIALDLLTRHYHLTGQVPLGRKRIAIYTRRHPALRPAALIRFD